MLKYIKQYLEERRRRLAKEEYDRGYGWAMTEFYSKNVSIDEIESYSYGRMDYFDLGAQDAIIMIRFIKP
jgi:hypothetical protein